MRNRHPSLQSARAGFRGGGHRSRAPFGPDRGDGNFPEFETKLREFLGANYLASTAEFSRSVEMALRMAGVGPGDSVLLSPLACLATTMPILQTGGRPVWCDIDPDTGSLNPAEITRKYSRGVKAVLFYHWVGVPGDIAGVLSAAAQVGIKVIEDAGEALGAEYEGRRVGAHGFDYSVFSFSPVRHITTGEGAAMTFRDAGQYELARMAALRHPARAIAIRSARFEPTAIYRLPVSTTT